MSSKSAAQQNATSPKKVSSDATLEDRLQPWIDQAEYVIALTIVIMAWAAGWVDMLDFESFEPVIFGQYTLKYFALFMAYTAGFAVWFTLIGSLWALERFKQGIAFVQRHPLVYVLAWIGFIALFRYMATVEMWREFPLLAGALLVLIALFTLLVLLSSPAPDAPFQMWRKVALGAIGALLLFEAVLQGFAYTGNFFFDVRSGFGVPYGRIVDTEHDISDMTNRYGWHYPEFTLADDTERILINGDRHVMATQIPREAHFGVELQARLNDSDTLSTEVLAQGQPGYGPEMTLYPRMWTYMWEPMQPDEMIVVLNLANDLDTYLQVDDDLPELRELSGATFVAPREFRAWHRDAHVVVAGHQPPAPVLTIYSQSLVLNTLGELSRRTGLLDDSTAPPAPPLASANDDAPFGEATFLFNTSDDDNQRAEKVYELMQLRLRTFSAYLQEQGVTVRVVTLPYFPPDFYAQASGAAWNTQFDGYDVLQPERRLREIAAAEGIPFVGAGAYWQQTASAEVLQDWFFNDGYLTEAGHDAFAEVLYACFYVDEISDACTP